MLSTPAVSRGRRSDLPDTYRALLAPGRGAFIHEGKTTVAHGGIALEEVLVPFVALKGERGDEAT